MAVAGSVLHTVVINMPPSGAILVMKREQAHSDACFGGSFEEIMGRLVAGRPVRLTEKRLAEFREWEDENS